RRHTRWPRDWSSDVYSSDLFLDREVRSLDVDVKILVVNAFRGLGQRRELRHSGVHEQHINFAQLLRNLREQLVHVRELRDVRLRSEERRVGKECRAGWGAE